jgi:hypothetical protein
MEAICSSETSVDFQQTTRPYIPADSSFHVYKRLPDYMASQTRRQYSSQSPPWDSESHKIGAIEAVPTYTYSLSAFFSPWHYEHIRAALKLTIRRITLVSMVTLVTLFSIIITAKTDYYVYCDSFGCYDSWFTELTVVYLSPPQGHVRYVVTTKRMNSKLHAPAALQWHQISLKSAQRFSSWNMRKNWWTDMSPRPVPNMLNNRPNYTKSHASTVSCRRVCLVVAARSYMHYA